MLTIPCPVPRFKLRRYTVDLSATMPDLMDLTEHIHFLRSDHARHGRAEKIFIHRKNICVQVLVQQ